MSNIYTDITEIIESGATSEDINTKIEVLRLVLPIIKKNESLQAEIDELKELINSEKNELSSPTVESI